MKSKSGNSLRSVLAHIVLIVLSFMCLFFFYILIINATRSHAELQKGFSALPGTHLLENLKNVANDGSFPMFRGIINSICISTACAGLCTYFSALTAYGLYAYEFKTRKIAFTFIMAILVMPTQVTAMGFLRLITKIKQKLTALLLIEGPALGLHLLRICSPQLLKQSLLLLIQKTNDPDPDHIREVLDELCRHGIPIIIVLPVDLLR